MSVLAISAVVAIGCGDNTYPSDSRDVTSFAFLATSNASLAADVSATINGTTITAMVPNGTNVTALVATFATTGTKVTVAGAPQITGITANDFTRPVVYTATAADGELKVYTVTVIVSAMVAKDITAFAFLAAQNAGLTADVTAAINGTAIAATVPFGTDVTALVATFATTGASVTVAGATQTSGATANDFTNPVSYVVTAADGSTRTFTATVTIAPSTAKDLTSFAFLSAHNAGLGADVTATINGTAISATVPFGTNVTALVATFQTTGASVAAGGAMQTSGATADNFASPVTYVVTAADSSTKTYVVTVTIAPSSAKDITAFAFLSAHNSGLAADVTATINGAAITLIVPFGSDVTALVATFQTTGASVAIGGVAQTSGATPNDFTSPVTYVVTAADNSTKTYAVTVAVAASPAKDLTAFAFLSVNNSGLGVDVTATINGVAITATVPFGTDVTALIATFQTTGASVAIGGVAQTSGMTANDFSMPVTYVVTAADSSTKTYTVSVTVALSAAKDLTTFAFLSADNTGLLADVAATINGSAITATLPFGTNVTALVATFQTSGASVAVGAVAQTSGATPNDFTSPVTYVVTAADNSTKTYSVTVTVAASPAKDLTAFAFQSAHNAGLSADVAATINGTAITATVPFGTDVTALIATFQTTGASVAVGGLPQTSSATANDFTGPVSYVVTAADNSTKTYTVTITVAPSPADDLTSFAFLSAHNGGLAADVTATINATAITATVPFGTNVTALVATFQTTGASVAVAGVPQTSSATANDFTTTLSYVVTAADNSMKTYTVTVTVAPSPAKDLTSFAFLSVNNGLAADVTATINGTAIAATVPFGTDITALIATFQTTGALVAIGGTVQTSGATGNDFSGPLAYTVFAADDSSQTYTVIVTVAANPAKDITAFAFRSVNNPGLGPTVAATIFGTSITATVPFGTDVTALVASFVTTGASVAVGGVAQTSDTTPNDFTGDVSYVVTAADTSTQTYTVSVTIAANPAKDLTSFQFLSVDNPGFGPDVTATIAGTAITATVPFGTDVSALVATFATTGASVAVGPVAQTSGMTPNDFTGDVAYVVTAADNSTQTYIVTVTIAPSPAKDITGFEFTSVGNAGLAADAIATIDGTAITVVVPTGPDITMLVATFATTGASVAVGGGAQTSGTSIDDFTNPVTYTVTAADLSTKTYTVTVVSFMAKVDFSTGVMAHFIALGDLNGDGLPDVAVVKVGSSSVSVFLNTTGIGDTTPSFAGGVDFITGTVPESVALADLNGDGVLDIVVTNGSPKTVSVFLNTTAIGATSVSLAPRADFTTGAGPVPVAIGDLNGDGLPDIVVGNESANTVSVLLSTTTSGATTATFQPKVDFSVGISPASIALADFNGDGILDVSVATNATVSVVLNTTTVGATTPSFAPNVQFAAVAQAFSVAVGDFNGDSAPDVAVANLGSNSVSILLDTAAPGATMASFAPTVNETTGVAPISVAIADFDGDGRPDLATANDNSRTVSILLNTTTASATTPSFATKVDIPVPSASGVLGLAVGDLNGDGKLDLVVVNGLPSFSVLLAQ